MTTVKNTMSAKAAVMTIWLVDAMAKGEKPIRLAKRTKKKTENTNGKNRMPSSPAAERTMPATNS